MFTVCCFVFVWLQPFNAECSHTLCPLLVCPWAKGAVSTSFCVSPFWGDLFLPVSLPSFLFFQLLSPQPPRLPFSPLYIKKRPYCVSAFLLALCVCVCVCERQAYSMGVYLIPQVAMATVVKSRKSMLTLEIEI